MFYSARAKTGFTLIELLIVISIIAILAAVGLVVYSTAQKQGRISKRIQDFRAIAAALEVYHTANNAYPSTSGKWQTECANVPGATQVSNSQVIPGLVPNYMPSFPSDPAMNTSTPANCYDYISNGTEYKLSDAYNSDMSTSDLTKQPKLVDPRWSCGFINPAECSNDCSGGPAGKGPQVWAEWSSNGPPLSSGDTATGAACW